MNKFWEQQEWLDRAKESNVELYNMIVNAKEIDIDWNTFSLIIDGVGYELKLDDGRNTNNEIKIIDENGDEKTYIR